MDTVEIVDDILEHHGTKGMKWGVTTKSPPSSGSRPQSNSSSNVQGSNLFTNKQQVAAMNSTAKKLKKAYGYEVKEFVPLTKKEEASKFMAYVDSGTGFRSKASNRVHMMNDPVRLAMLKDLQKSGWFPPSGGHNVEGIITHEVFHSMMHVPDTTGKGFVGRLTAPQPIKPMRKSAWAKSEAQAIKDGDVVKGFTKQPAQMQMAQKTSKYAHSSMYTEEHEAEMFTAYHWSPNPPKFVDVFMKDIHSSMGKEVKPFSGRKV